MSSPQWHIGSATDPGIKRRDRPNEDALGVVHSRFDPRPPLVVVADGMGGYRGGAFASQIVVETFKREYRKARIGSAASDLLERLVKAAHAELTQVARKDEHLQDMGSTVVAAILGADRVGIVNVGDSRAYLLHNGALRQVSTDQSRVAELLMSGQVTEEEARDHPQRSLLTMSLSPKRAEVRPIIEEEKIEEGDTLLMCTDGLWITLSKSEIAGVIGDLDPQPAADKLVELANTSQAPDNVSVVVARLGKRTKTDGVDDDTES